MTELGARLKEARLAKGYSIDDLQEITKIQKRYLTGIEEGNYATMPGAFYVRAFIKQYAEAVGLNGDELLESYKTDIPSPTNDDVSKSIPATPSRRSLGGRTSNKFMEAFPMIVVALFIIAIIVIVWILYQNKPEDSKDVVEPNDNVLIEQKPQSEQNTKDPVVEEQEPEEPEEPVEEEVEEPVVDEQLTFVETQGETSTYNLTGGENYVLKVVATNKTWLNIRDQDNKILVDQAVSAGETFELDVTNLSKVRVRLGSTPGNTVSINDQVVEFPTDMVTQNLVIQFQK
ncbi:helix-turn-helix domain-containing protein [Psychrobacillus lasiicapitis]|uniref:Helix-turn-helix domain-containing protein n=1 Tax=Psychrobacillus lasiicapitis TaxID=1636719 RepID=A0A544STG8_9BACI|nr:helix-turn-helix domain-containing protein [Psychrobacillus lasiicapitis]TQR08463.1 helix-turn-helix domain-containing protein [Psychrobacillus lasiicapitis]GGA15694.1 XRE family transcriptional regulator [Psychrobacillus lasiicapitis]